MFTIAKIVSIISGKGGCGKTLLATNVAAGLHSAPKKCLLVDCSFGIRNSDIVLGYSTDILFNLRDVLLGDASFADSVVNDRSGSKPDFLASSIGNCPDNLHSLMQNFIDLVSERYDYIVFDTPASLGKEFEVCTSLSDIILAVTYPDFISVSNTALCIKRISNSSTKKVFLILNFPYGFESDSFVEDIIDEIGFPLIGVMGYDSSLSSIPNGKLIINTDTYIAKELKRIVKRLCNEYVGPAKLRFSERLFDKIKSF